SVEDALLYDGTDGRLRNAVAIVMSQDPIEPNVEEAFQRMGGDFWYFMHRLWGCLQRGELHFARRNYQIVSDKLSALMRIEFGSTTGWSLDEPTRGLEHDLSPERLDEFEAGLDIVDQKKLYASCARLIALGADVSKHIAEKHNWPWPQELAQELQQLFSSEK
ncbi:MAG: aminoglycoside 6-adenylyltransferase, partial [Planctomycetes bacterium]|nr:aminoglycoside 6-adenylyltransferase [Planctomycetota bacterium]